MTNQWIALSLLATVCACGTLREAEQENQRKTAAKESRGEEAAAFEQRGRGQMRATQFAEAQISFEKAQQLSFSPNRLVAIAETYEARKMYCRAKPLYKKFHSRYGRGQPIDAEVVRRLQRLESTCPNWGRGVAAYKNGNYEDARRYLTIAIIKGLNAEHQRFYLGLTYEKLGKPCLAAAMFRTYVTRQPDGEMVELAKQGRERTRCSVDDLVARGEAAASAGNRQLAVQYFRLALRNEPTRVAVHLRLSAVYEQERDVCAAAKSAKQFLDSETGPPGAKTAVVRQRHGRLKDECKALMRAAKKGRRSYHDHWKWPFG